MPADSSLGQKIFEVLSKSPARTLGDAFLNNLPLAIRDKIIGQQTPQEFGGEGSQLFSSPTLEEQSAANDQSAAKQEQRQNDYLANSIGFMPAVGATRFAKNLLEAGIPAELAAAKDRGMKSIIGDAPFGWGWQYEDRANYIKAFRQRMQELKDNGAKPTGLYFDIKKKLSEADSTLPRQANNMWAPDRSNIIPPRKAQANLPDAKPSLYKYPKQIAVDRLNEIINEDILHPTGRSAQILNADALSFADAALDNKNNNSKLVDSAIEYLNNRVEPTLGTNAVNYRAAQARAAKQDVLKKIAENYKPVLSDEAKANLKYMENYAKEAEARKNDISNLFSNANKYVAPEMDVPMLPSGYTPDNLDYSPMFKAAKRGRLNFGESDIIPQGPSSYMDEFNTKFNTPPDEDAKSADLAARLYESQKADYMQGSKVKNLPNFKFKPKGSR